MQDWLHCADQLSAFVKVSSTSNKKCSFQLKSKKRFVENFVEFEKQASDIQCKTIGLIFFSSALKVRIVWSNFSNLPKDIQHIWKYFMHSGNYPYCKRLDPMPATQRSVTCKLVKKSKRHKIVKKTKTSQLNVGSKRSRNEGIRKGWSVCQKFVSKSVFPIH